MSTSLLFHCTTLTSSNSFFIVSILLSDSCTARTFDLLFFRLLTVGIIERQTQGQGTALPEPEEHDVAHLPPQLPDQHPAHQLSQHEVPRAREAGISVQLATGLVHEQVVAPVEALSGTGAGEQAGRERGGAAHGDGEDAGEVHTAGEGGEGGVRVAEAVEEDEDGGGGLRGRGKVEGVGEGGGEGLEVLCGGDSGGHCSGACDG
ncbi:unnamed protein product [Clonostachys chloroleuca]|uniref:Uncharacterized protein n=1 Tax=Clonostachys chloroleuca TaxID=1926264 RepID=A0AA35QE56_9HYPO|nr:unnamed protein product [Clonostachys chloroleuca]